MLMKSPIILSNIVVIMLLICINDALFISLCYKVRTLQQEPKKNIPMKHLEHDN